MMISLTTYGEWQNNVFTFLSQYVKSNTSMVFDVFAGVGLNHVSLGNITPTQIFSIESDQELYQLLLRNSQVNGVLSRALVGQLDPTLPFVDITELRSGLRGLYRNVFDLYRMTSQCPTVVKLSELFNESILEDAMIKMITSLVQSLWLLKYCQPLYYIAGSTSTYPLIRILSSLPNYRVFWHITTTISMSTPHRKQDNQVVISLVAIPFSMYDSHDVLCDDNICDALLIPVEANKYFMQNYDVKLRYKVQETTNSIDDDDNTNSTDDILMTGRIVQHTFTSERTCDQSDHIITRQTVPILHHESIADAPLSTSCNTTNLVTFYVHLEAIMSPFHPLMDEYDGPLSETPFIASSKPALMFQECFVTLPSLELYMASIFEARCILWLSTLPLRLYDSIRVDDPKHARYTNRYTENELLDDLTAQQHENNTPTDNTVHIHALVKACAVFAVKQWHMMHDVAMYRASSPVSILPHRAVKAVNNNNIDDNHDINNNNHNNHHHHNTTPNSIENEVQLVSNHTHPRPPFSLLPHPEACGEPLWCTHTIELQRRLTAWQNPHLPNQIVRKREGSVHTTPHPRDSHKDSTDPPSLPSNSSKQKRTCQNAKFLLFQPRSDQNGIGGVIYPSLHLNYP